MKKWHYSIGLFLSLIATGLFSSSGMVSQPGQTGGPSPVQLTLLAEIQRAHRMVNRQICGASTAIPTTPFFGIQGGVHSSGDYAGDLTCDGSVPTSVVVLESWSTAELVAIATHEQVPNILAAQTSACVAAVRMGSNAGEYFSYYLAMIVNATESGSTSAVVFPLRVINSEFFGFLSLLDVEGPPTVAACLCCDGVNYLGIESCDEQYFTDVGAAVGAARGCMTASIAGLKSCMRWVAIGLGAAVSLCVAAALLTAGSAALACLGVGTATAIGASACLDSFATSGALCSAAFNTANAAACLALAQRSGCCP